MQNRNKKKLFDGKHSNAHIYWLNNIWIFNLIQFASLLKHPIENYFEFYYCFFSSLQIIIVGNTIKNKINKHWNRMKTFSVSFFNLEIFFWGFVSNQIESIDIDVCASDILLAYTNPNWYRVIEIENNNAFFSLLI